MLDTRGILNAGISEVIDGLYRMLMGPCHMVWVFVITGQSSAARVW